MGDSGAGGRPEYLVVGLGNPGARYEATRHNVGFQVLDRLALRGGAGRSEALGHSLVTQVELSGHRVWLARPQTYMNRSGAAAVALLGCAGLTGAHLWVVHDDLDLPFGRLRIREAGGHGGHNGIRSIAEALGGGGFGRLKVGIGRPALRGEEVDHVLSPFAPDEQALLSGLLDRAADAVESIIVEGPVRAMIRFHTQPFL
ncbi:MAG: aminoacyl-tRNA hydrolase [Deferrisomatales bacterium]